MAVAAAGRFPQIDLDLDIRYEADARRDATKPRFQYPVRRQAGAGYRCRETEMNTLSI